MSHPVRRIFVASSSEATALARLVGIVLEQVDSEPVLWTSEIFPPGATLLERIESLPAEVDGAILLMTPDVSCRRGGKKFATPVANILFEYGYLAARMTRNRVAICRSAGAHIPTDLSNIKFIEFGSSDPGLPEIPVRAAADITAWVRGLPRLASGMQAVVQFHGYSGYWRVRNRFTLWHDYVPKSGEKIYFDGRAIILLPINGKGGTGSILGYLHVSLKNYRASYEILDEILGATIDADGVLTMKVRVIRRHCHESEGSAPDSRFTEDLPNRDFELSLEPVPGHAGLLQGKHTYEQGIEPYSRAEERYEHIDHYRQ